MTRLSKQFCLYLRALNACFLVLFTALPSLAFTKCGQVLFSKIILGVFVVWKKVVVKR